MEGKKQAGQSQPLPTMEDAMPDGPAELQAIALKLQKTIRTWNSRDGASGPRMAFFQG